MRRRAAVFALLAVGVAVAVLVVLAAGAGSKGTPRRERSAPRLGPPLLLPISQVPDPLGTASAAARPSGAASGPAEPPGRPVPVLMYHVTQKPPPGSRYPDLFVSPAQLGDQVRVLRRAGYHAVTLRAAYDYWHRRTRLPRKPVVLSFDDGYRSNYTKAMPILRRARWPGLLFLEVADLKKKGFDGISPAQVRALADAGWEIGAHTITHPDLTTANPAQLRTEVAGSRRYIIRHFGLRVDFFAYPAGKYNPAVEAAVRRAGFLGAATEDEGLAAKGQRMALKRIRVSGGDTGPRLLARIRAGG
jgi:peptidoglycan/xylan/chitin deacetylase (PgdA/CDA1 family)